MSEITQTDVNFDPQTCIGEDDSKMFSILKSNLLSQLLYYVKFSRYLNLRGSQRKSQNFVGLCNLQCASDYKLKVTFLTLCLGEPVKIPQNYPDVTLHPVAPSTAGQNSASQQSGSLLHGILTKTQSQSQSQSQPRSNTFSPTLARLLTAPERERNSPVTAAAAVAAVTAASMSQQNATAQHHLQTYQGSNMVSINDLLSSSKVCC